jgi:hypothetical protein
MTQNGGIPAQLQGDREGQRSLTTKFNGMWAIRRAAVDRQYVDQFAARVRALFPACPTGRERDIAEHACLKYSGRVGRSASAKALDEEAVRLAVMAHIRHRETPYDALLARGHDRWEARAAVEEAVRRVLQQWGAQQ